MCDSNEIAERIKEYAKQENISLNKMLSDINLGKNTLSNFKTSMPKADNLAKIADYLGCTVDYLMGKTDIDKQLEEVDFALYGEVKDLTDDEKKDVLKFVQFLKSKNEEN